MSSKLEELLRTEARKALDETIAEMLDRDADSEPDNGPWGQVPEGTRWAILRHGPGTERWRASFAMTFPWRNTPFSSSVITFDTYQDAADCIKTRGLDAQPWPVPLS